MPKSLLSAGIAAVLALGIFIFDTISPLQFAVAVLYVIVISVVAAYFKKRDLLIAASGCAALTVVSYPLAHGTSLAGAAPLRGIMSLAAIGITTLLALKNLSATERLRETERERANLTRFFSPQLVDQLVAIDAPLSIARYQPAAVLFVDMVGFTAYCSRMTPEAVIALLRDLMTLLSDCVFSNHGTLDKFLGDGLMAVFGAPMASALDATNAARCALDIQRSINDWNERYHRFGDAAIWIAVGIHYGDVVQGDIGSDKRLELTVVGDTVNTASRVEAYCRSLDAAILVTGALVDELYAEDNRGLAEKFTDQGYHILRGHVEPIHLYGVNRSRPHPVLSIQQEDINRDK
jgi:adenylate cyclase